ncbi:MAG: PH domain-containing protein [Chloroflexi bacterium]|nr:MAG: PH domain-containing protein [Chloroflexota bacterium]
MTKDLMPGETLVLKSHQHWAVLLAPLLIPLVLVVAAVLVDYFATGLNRDYKIIGTLLVVAILGLWLIVLWVRWRSRSFMVTDRRVILEEGVFSRSSKVIALDRVQDIATRQSLLGRLFGFGHIEIDSAGAAGAEVLEALPKPQRFRDEVFVRAEKLRTQGLEEGTPQASDV